MKIFSKMIFVYLLVLAATCFAADTLEVFALRVQFAEEKTDNSLTTGNGLFDSDKAKKSAYKLDPPGYRNSVHYWQKHFDFVNAYFKAASNGNQVIKARIFPEESSAYSLEKGIIDYNRTSKMEGEKTAEFDEARSRDYLRFIYDAVMEAHKDKYGESPFSIPLSKNPGTKRAFMIIHAGASRLVDGGSMGTNNADTPGDFLDVYIGRDAWEYLPDTLAGTAVNEDSVVNGLVLEGASIDTLRSIMVTSETASQDGLNWGVNGILVNQIGRELGLPNTYDVVKGISRLGYYDVMDFAGYNAGNGFLPSMPAAWERVYMGWNKVETVYPTAGKPVTVKIAAAGTGLGTEIVKVPLSGSEYLLIENRQRSWNKDGTVSVVLGYDDDGKDTLIRTVSVDSLHSVFEDSTCADGKCSVNKQKASGIILDVSSFDAGIPASGIAVWRVNDWYLRETLGYGIANFWAGDTLRDHQFGLAMVEADGILSIGKTFKNALGEDTYDYGSGTDLLPHLRLPGSSSSQKFDTVKTINPTGYANTMTTQGGYTGIKISVAVPEEYRKEKTSNGFMGDSVLNFAAQVITVTISVDDGSLEDSKFPRNVGVASAVRGAVFVEDPEDKDSKSIVIGGSDGTLQMFTALGDTLYSSDTVVTVNQLSLKDTVKQVPLYRLSENDGALVGMASDGKSVYSLHKERLVRTSFLSGMIPQKDELKVDGALAGPMVYEGKVWIATKSSLKSAVVKDGALAWDGDSLAFTTVLEKASFDSFVAQDMAVCSDKDRKRIAVVGEQGNWISYPLNYVAGGDDEIVYSEKSSAKDGFFRVACTDMDRNGIEDMILLGSRGTVMAKSVASKKSNVKNTWEAKTYKRGAVGSSVLKDETSGMAIGDINNDGYPEVVFLGYNLVYALDRFGLPLAGFPISITRGSPVYGFFSDPLIVDVNGDEVPEILVPSSDGLVYAFNGKGKMVTDGFPIAAGSFEYADSVQALQPMSIFVTDAVPAKKSAGPELYALHRNNVAAFRLRKADTDADRSAMAWSLPAGGNERDGYFDASGLKSLETAKSENKISEFFMFPNPVRGGIAKARFEIGAEAQSATLELYDITGLCVYKTKMSDVKRGRNQFEHLDLRKLGSDVYTARLQVKFADGKTKQKLYRVGVVR